MNCAPTLISLFLFVGCSDSSSHAVVESPAEPVEDPVDEPVEDSCAPIIYQQLIFVVDREVLVVLPFEYDGRVTVGEETTNIGRGREWRSDYSTTRRSRSVSVTADHHGDADCPEFGETITDHADLPEDNARDRKAVPTSKT